jgi:hypothetical protein
MPIRRDIDSYFSAGYTVLGSETHSCHPTPHCHFFPAMRWQQGVHVLTMLAEG